MSTFKVFFSEENIRRIRFPEIPSYLDFMRNLEKMYSQFHPELVLKYVDEDGDMISVDTQIEWEEMLAAGTTVYKLYVEESQEGYFKDGPMPEAVKLYTDEITQEAVDFASDFMADLQRNVPECLASLFNGGKIIPSQFPEFLKDAVEMKYLRENVVDLDVDIPKLFDLLHGKALQLLDSVDTSDLEKGRDYLLATLTLVPDHMIALYNLACAESLLGNVEEAVQNLEKAVNAGYRDFTHMIQDADLDNIKNTEAFQFLAGRVASLSEFTEHVFVPETISETIEETIEEPKPECDLSASIMPLKTSFSEELSILQSMGFTADQDVLLLLLEQYAGNVEEVAQFLLNF